MKRATPATKAGKAHMARIAGMPCICCELLGMEQETPTAVHHIREGRIARNDHLTLPLCWSCHQGPRGVHGDKGWLKQLGMGEVDMLGAVIEKMTAKYGLCKLCIHPYETRIDHAASH